MGTTTGFGLANAKPDEQFGLTLSQLQFPIIQQNDFESHKICNYIAAPELFVCTGGNKGPCISDAGGPLTYRRNEEEPWYQIGLHSFGARVCENGLPDAFTKVAPYLDWIASKMEP